MHIIGWMDSLSNGIKKGKSMKAKCYDNGKGNNHNNSNNNTNRNTKHHFFLIWVAWFILYIHGSIGGVRNDGAA